MRASCEKSQQNGPGPVPVAWIKSFLVWIVVYQFRHVREIPGMCGLEMDLQPPADASQSAIFTQPITA